MVLEVYELVQTLFQALVLLGLCAVGLLVDGAGELWVGSGEVVGQVLGEDLLLLVVSQSAWVLLLLPALVDPRK